MGEAIPGVLHERGVPYLLDRGHSCQRPRRVRLVHVASIAACVNLVAADFCGRAAVPVRLAAGSAKSRTHASRPSGYPPALRGSPVVAPPVPGLSGAPQDVRVAHLADALSDHALDAHALIGSCASSAALPVLPDPSGAALVSRSKTTMRECRRSRRPAQPHGP